MTTGVHGAARAPGANPPSMSTVPTKSSGGSPEVLPVIDETRPSNVEVPDLDGEEEEGKRCSSAGPAGPCRKKGVKGRIRGLKDKYVSCLQTIDGAGDMRGCALGVPDAQPYDCATSAASLSTTSIAH